jgi:Flp pilus assembly protein TadD
MRKPAGISGEILIVLVGAGVAWCQSASSLYQEGLRLFAERQTGAAIEALQRSVGLDPGNALAWRALGVVLASAGETARAEESFRNACERRPGLENACLYHGRTLYLLDRFPPALEVLRKAQKVNEGAEVHRLMALCLEALGRIEEAESEFRTALKLPANGAPDEDAGIDYGVMLFRQGRAEQALEPLRGAVARRGGSARAHLELGCVLLALDRIEEAAGELERSLAIRDSSRAHMLLAKACQRMGRHDEAEKHLRLIK